jgi:hypothetical protein
MNLKSNNNIKIIEADKGRNTVIMNTDDYNTKMNDIIEDKNNYKLQQDDKDKIIKTYKTELKHFLKDQLITKETHIKLLPKNKILPKLFGKPKIHKENIPMRPIISYNNSFLWELGETIAPDLKELNKYNNKHNIRNSTELINLTKNVYIPNDCILVSYDIVSMFTSIPHNLILENVTNAFNNLNNNNILKFNRNSIIKLIELGLNYNYFDYKGSIYKQNTGCPMGNQTSPILANIVMNTIDIWINREMSGDIIIWKRYVDDIFCVIKYDRAEITLDKLNNYNPKLKFTIEKQKNSSLPFLDILFSNQTNKLITKVYRKTTHTGHYLAYNSEGPISHKINTVQTLTKRAYTHTSNKKDYYIEIKNITEELI